jgi:hypothetical protein
VPKIYRESIGFFLSALPVLLLLALVIEGLLWVLQPRSESGATFVALTIVAYCFHRHFLFGESFGLKMKPDTAAGAPPFKFGWFMLVSAALVALPLAVAIVIAFRFPPSQVLGIMVITIFPLYLLALSFFGTALPATVARDGTYRISQGIRAGFGTMWRLIAGPGVVGLVLLLLSVALARVIEAAGVPEHSLVLLAGYTVARMLGFLTTIIAVAVLCEMYRKTRPAPHDRQGTGATGQTPA